MNYSRQDTLRKQQAMLSEQRRLLRWYKDGPNKEHFPTVMESLGVPSSLWDASMEGVSDTVRTKVSDWADGAKQNLYIEGGRRMHKSYTSAAVLRKMVLRNKIVGWRSWFTIVQSGYDRIRMSELNGDDYADALYAESEERWHLNDVIQVLVLDEMDLRKTPDFMMHEMLLLLRHRTDWGLRTILNSRRPLNGQTEDAKDFMAYVLDTSVLINSGT